MQVTICAICPHHLCSMRQWEVNFKDSTKPWYMTGQALDYLHFLGGLLSGVLEVFAPLLPLVIISSSNPAKGALIEKGTSDPVPPSVDPGLFSRIFVVPKKSGGVFPIIDLKALNGFLRTKCFKMESAEYIRAALLMGMWKYSIDLKNTYFHIPLHPKSKRFL